MTDTAVETTEVTTPAFDSDILPEGMRTMYDSMYLPAVQKIAEEADKLAKEGKGRADRIAKWKTEDAASADLRAAMAEAKTAYDNAVKALNDAADNAVPAKTKGYETKVKALQTEQANAKAIRRALETVLTDEQKATLPDVPTLGRASSSGSSTALSNGASIRAWARDNGWSDLSDHGRLSEEIKTAYDKAHSNGESAS